MSRSRLLIVDGVANFVLAVLLLLFPADLVAWLGMPPVQQRFYPTLLGAVLLGIALALFIEAFEPVPGVSGLGLGAAVSINLSAAAVLIVWLLSGSLAIPTRGYILLWLLTALLVALSLVEILVHRRQHS